MGGTNSTGGRVLHVTLAMDQKRAEERQVLCSFPFSLQRPLNTLSSPESCVNCGKASTLLALFDALRDTHSDPATRIDGVPLTLSYSDDPKAAASSKSPTMTFQSSSAFSTPRKSTASASYSGADDEDDEDPSSAALTLRDLFPLGESCVSVFACLSSVPHLCPPLIHSIFGATEM